MIDADPPAETKRRGHRYGGPAPSRMTHLRAWLAGTYYDHQDLTQRQALADKLHLTPGRLHKLFLGHELPGTKTALALKRMSLGKLDLDKLQDPDCYLVAPQEQTNAVKAHAKFKRTTPRGSRYKRPAPTGNPT